MYVANNCQKEERGVRISMEITSWFIILVVTTLSISVLIKPILNLLLNLFPASTSSLHKNKKKLLLPPGPAVVPVIGNLLWLVTPLSKLPSVLSSLRAKYGPIITLRIGSRPAIFIGSPTLAYQALVQNGAVFSDRPKAVPTAKNSNKHTINSAPYGPTWRHLRRNLTSGILHPSRVKSYSSTRQRVLAILFDRLVLAAAANKGVSRVGDHFQYAMFFLFAVMCFGDKLDEKQIREVERVQRQWLMSARRFDVLNFFPMLGKILYRNLWKELRQVYQSKEDVLIPLIRSQVEAVKQRQGKTEPGKESVVAYVDTLVDLELPNEKRKLNEKEMVSLCTEFLNASSDTTSTALQWIMANLVKYPHIQTKLYEEIKSIVGPSPRLGKANKKVAMRMIKDEDLQRMPYLKSVVLEGLRRHPPSHLVMPHMVTKDVEFDGYLLPQDAIVNFLVAEIGCDPNMWDEPMEFKPERFLTNTNSGDGEMVDLFDITGSKEIKMMPFGAGRRICPAAGLALLHLEFFVANFVWYVEWRIVEGDKVDLSEKLEFSTVMKYPLQAHISLRGGLLENH